ncbi:MAG: hypothetical protein EXS05_09735 [Planctomycetaceae bacterium]|nr:hypothetical protein [Planctomycetaceae bacterium]
MFEPSDEGGYTAYVPALSGCIFEGETLEDTLPLSLHFRRRLADPGTPGSSPSGEKVESRQDASRRQRPTAISRSERIGAIDRIPVGRAAEISEIQEVTESRPAVEFPVPRDYLLSADAGQSAISL